MEYNQDLIKDTAFMKIEYAILKDRYAYKFFRDEELHKGKIANDPTPDLDSSVKECIICMLDLRNEECVLN